MDLKEVLTIEALAKFGHPASLSTTANAQSSESESNEREFCEPRPFRESVFGILQEPLLLHGL